MIFYCKKKMIRVQLLRNSVAFVWLVVLVCCLSVIIISSLRLPKVSLEGRPIGLNRPIVKITKDSEGENHICKFGQMMIEMLPEDLPFTVFVPSKRAFERDLRLQANDSMSEEEKNDAYAIVSRVLGFSAIPRSLNSGDVRYSEEILHDSISGFALYISKDKDGMLVVNRVRSERVDVKRKETIVHVMDGVIMDSEFEESVQPDNDDEEDT